MIYFFSYYKSSKMASVWWLQKLPALFVYVCNFLLTSHALYFMGWEGLFMTALGGTSYHGKILVEAWQQLACYSLLPGKTVLKSTRYRGGGNAELDTEKNRNNLSRPNRRVTGTRMGHVWMTSPGWFPAGEGGPTNKIAPPVCGGTLRQVLCFCWGQAP